MTTAKNTDAPDDSWIAEKILAKEDKLMEQLMKAQFDPSAEVVPQEPAPATDTPVDPAAEQAAFADLIAFFAANPEKDCEVAALTAQEFAQETFTPPAADVGEAQE